MNQLSVMSADNVAIVGERLKIKKRLVREISCLERQLSRLRHHIGKGEGLTLNTYEEMIEARQEMLDSLGG